MNDLEYREAVGHAVIAILARMGTVGPTCHTCGSLGFFGLPCDVCRFRALKRKDVPRMSMSHHDVRMLVEARARYRCECCGGPLTGPFGYSLHHRKPRGMGGSKDPALNLPSNFLAVCGSGTTGCHGKIEKSRAWAYEHGFLVHRNNSPARTPVRQYPALGEVWLDDHGNLLREEP